MPLFSESRFKLRPKGEIKEGEKEKKEPLPIADEIKNWLKNTSLSEEAKAKLLEESLKIYEQIKDLSHSEKDKSKASLALACDDYLCAIPRQIPRPRLKVLSEARRITKIESVEAIQRVDSMCKLIKRSPEVAEKAKKILRIYKEKYPTDYDKGTPSGTAVGTLYIAAILEGEHITQYELWKSLGITEGTIRKRYKDITEKLDIDILKSFFSIKH